MALLRLLLRRDHENHIPNPNRHAGLRLHSRLAVGEVQRASIQSNPRWHVYRVGLERPHTGRPLYSNIRLV